MKNKTTLEDVLEKIHQWTKDNEVEFIGSFMEFDSKTFEITDDRLLCFGCKDNMNLALKELKEEVDETQGDFVNL